MPIYSDKNLYPGINPHLNSALQQLDGDWQSFHAYHLIMLADALNNVLPSAYYAKPEQSLQIKIYDVPPHQRTSRSRADTLIYHAPESAPETSSASKRSIPTLTLPTREIIDEMDELTALVIYKGDRPVTRLELLSPANKPPGSHFEAYEDKRAETLHSGLRFVELDYLHERKPTIERLASYPDRQAGAYPYHIIVFEAHPTFETAMTDVYGFGILDAIPTINIPLEGQEVISFDFNEAYNQTYIKRPFARSVDYAQEPANFAAYTPEDQARIRQHMQDIADNQ